MEMIQGDFKTRDEKEPSFKASRVLQTILNQQVHLKCSGLDSHLNVDALNNNLSHLADHLKSKHSNKINTALPIVHVHLKPHGDRHRVYNPIHSAAASQNLVRGYKPSQP